ncbi:hypothetical protein CPB83DRAFT_860542 [Crepidotus variabilis]|uniref:HTH APSES-type domain-containing protein n=1 Tax=Crepidotus variabilis TaxID=179855 RepID=A0A9P6E8T2_9AGAR|nr:hypothetical protein CPB83DRAFT_860542 [Crepidotus variabilis]
MGVRPPLPYRSVNPHIKEHLGALHLPPVKYQILNCQGKDILVGRLKIDTPTEAGHAFILRRYDTGAISLTTMFRAAFPHATDYEEKSEVQWVKDTYDLAGTNGSTKDATITRLAGTWVHPPLAVELGKSYALGALIESMVAATPDPSGTYRRSGKAAANKDTTNTAPSAPSPARMTTTTTTVQSSTIVVSKPVSAAKSLPTPSPTAGNPPAKRRKDSSPAPVPSYTKPPSIRASPVKPPSTTSTLTNPRRSARARTRSKSPAPKPLTAMTTVRTPKRASKKDQVSSVTPGSSELTAVDEEGPAFEEGPAGTELMEEDILEQQQLIENMKSQRAAAAAAKADEAHMDVSEEASTSSNKKRDREEDNEPLLFEFKEPENEERQIATNRRVGRFALEPRTKSFAWGVAAFAVGMGAVTFLPSLFG